MADLGTTVKGIWIRGMEAVGNVASSIASNTKSKVDEMNLMNRRREILSDFGDRAYVLWQKGEHFPEELAQQLDELQRLDEQLNDLRAERLAGVKAQQEQAEPEEAESPEENAAADEEDAGGEEASTEEDASADETDPLPGDEEKEVPVIRVEKPEEAEQEGPDVRESIQSLFDGAPSAQEAAEKVNSALDSLGEGLKQLSDQVDEGISELADRLKGE